MTSWVLASYFATFGAGYLVHEIIEQLLWAQERKRRAEREPPSTRRKKAH